MTLPIIAAVTIACAAACATSEENSTDSVTSPFKYREVYLPEGIGKNAKRLHLNTLENDWGIWGHNLNKVLPEKPSNSIYAKVNGNTLKQQFCFSSPTLFEYIEEYMDSKYDEDTQVRFSIMPNDNDIVCLCEICKTAGNTKGDASPAVNQLVRKLAERFPNHIFYTSDYRTTRSLPKDTMPSNTGVLLSAMTYPLSMAQTPEEEKFIYRINEWHNTTPRILVWDYINNFDDYFTPYPIFGVMQRRLKNYRDNNVTALFLNGSGNDPSAFSDLKAEVLAEMTANPDIDWKEVLKQKAAENYPVTGALITDFIIAQEEFFAEKGIPLPLYEGVEVALETYLPVNTFDDLHNSLLNVYPTVEGPEKDKLDILMGQLALPALEIKRIKGDLTGTEPLIANLSNLTGKEIYGYNEAGWTIESYVNDYNFLLKNFKETNRKNKLKGEKIVALTPLDPQYSDLSILTDGVLGIPSNYHSGLLINSPAEYTKLAIPNKPGTKKLKVWFDYNPPYRILLPESVNLSVGGVSLGDKSPAYPADNSGRSSVEFDIPSNVTGTFILTVYKQPETHSMAMDEIQEF